MVTLYNDYGLIRIFWGIGMAIEIREMTLQDYDACLALWSGMEGLGLSHADEMLYLMFFLERNLHLSFVALAEQRLVGTVLCGHDGRRGFIYHLAVDPDFRRQGIATQMLDRCVDGLKEVGIEKCHVMVYKENESGLAFWRRAGWLDRPELVILSKMF